MNIAKIIKNKINNVSEAKSVTIAFFGDSVTMGCFEVVAFPGEDKFATTHEAEYAYHNVLRKMLQTVFPTVPFNIINAGISGAKAIDAMERIERDVLFAKPDLTIVCFGLNDSKFGEEGIENYKKSLGKIFATLQEMGSEVIFMTPNMMNTKVSPYLYDEKLRELAAEIMKRQVSGLFDMYIDAAKETAEKYGVKICDCYDKWKKLESIGADTTELLSNKINHPTREMHKLFAGYLFHTILFE